MCGHKFADLSEFGYGVAILNDCKYGYATEGNVMRLSLLRAPTEPDPECDMGSHEFSFAIYPHKGTFAESDVPVVAAAFNAPMRRECTGSCIVLMYSERYLYRCPATCSDSSTSANCCDRGSQRDARNNQARRGRSS